MKLLYLIFTVVLLVGLTACDKLNSTNELDSNLKSGEPYFSLIYNKSFAARFALSLEEIEELSNGLQAIAIEISKTNFHYRCDLHLYLDDKLDIYVPEAGKYFFDIPVAEQFYINAYNDNDQIWNSQNIDKNLMHIRFNSTPLAKYRFTSTLSYSRVHRSFLPGLTIVSLSSSCDMFERNRYPADIWIQKPNVVDYLVGNDGPGEIKQVQNNHRFPIPIKLIDQIQPFIKIIEAHGNWQ